MNNKNQKNGPEAIFCTFLAQVLFDKLDALETSEQKAKPKDKFKFQNLINSQKERINEFRMKSEVFDNLAAHFYKRRNLIKVAPTIQSLLERLELLEQPDIHHKYASVS